MIQKIARHNSYSQPAAIYISKYISRLNKASVEKIFSIIAVKLFRLDRGYSRTSQESLGIVEDDNNISIAQKINTMQRNTTAAMQAMESVPFGGYTAFDRQRTKPLRKKKSYEQSQEKFKY